VQRAGVFGPEGPKEFIGPAFVCRAEVVGITRFTARATSKSYTCIVIARLRTDAEVKLMNRDLFA